MSETSALLLRRQLKDLSKSPYDYFSAGLVNDDNIYEWEIMVMPPSGTLYEGGFFKARMKFPNDYPEQPPTLTFTTPIWHPNVYPDGKVCISILHPPGEDAWGYEKASERWLPIYTVESIMVSVISMLSEPNDESPANIDAAVRFAYDCNNGMLMAVTHSHTLFQQQQKEWRENCDAFKKRVARLIRRSIEDM